MADADGYGKRAGGAPVGAAVTWRGPKMGEFVALMAALMASNALAIDAMLPALPAIGAALDVARPNDRSLVITTYLLGFGLAQIVWGPLADRFGRKRLLLIGLAGYALASAAAGLAWSFPALLAARFGQGVAASASRVLVVSVIRDRFEGAAMARTMSLVMIVFMVMPVVAPAFGQAVLAVGDWRYIFIGLGAYGLALALWSLLRLPETLAPEARRPLSIANLTAASAATVGNRQSIGNTVASTLVFGGLFSFINSVQQIVGDIFGRPELLAAVFAAIAVPMAASSYLNSRLVERIGARRLLLWALTGFTTIASIHLAIAAGVGETIWSFVILQALTMACFGLIGANAGALAMAPLGRMAGTAASIQGLIGTVGGALIGLVVAQLFDGTTIPLAASFTVLGAAALVVGRWANPPDAPGRTDR